MECWSCAHEGARWQCFPGTLDGLAGALRERPACLALLSSDPEAELEVLRTAMVLARRIGGPALTVFLAGPQPDIDLIARLEAGACPDLRTSLRGDTLLCLCGAASARLVVAGKRRQRHCLAAYSTCPFHTRESATDE